MLHTPPFAHRHEIGDDRGARLGDLGDLLKRASHRNSVLDNLFGIRFQLVTSLTVTQPTTTERACPGQRFGDHLPVVAARPRQVPGCTRGREYRPAATKTTAPECCAAGPADRWTGSQARKALQQNGIGSPCGSRPRRSRRQRRPRDRDSRTSRPSRQPRGRAADCAHRRPATRRTVSRTSSSAAVKSEPPPGSPRFGCGAKTLVPVGFSAASRSCNP